MKRYAKWIVGVLLLTQLFSFSAIAALAAPGPDQAYNPALSPDEIRSQLNVPGDVDVLTDDQMSRLIHVCHAVGAYLVRNADGTLSLTLQDPNRVGVSHAFLREYRTGLEEINALIRRGWLTVDDQFNLQPAPGLPTNATEIEQGLTEVEQAVAGKAVFRTSDAPDAVAPDAVAPDHHYSRGFLFSFHSGRHHIPYRYASFGPTFASFFHQGYYTGRFSLLFGLHRSFFQRTFYYGGYGYIPHRAYYNHYGYNLFYYYPYYYGGYGRWYYTYLWY